MKTAFATVIYKQAEPYFDDLIESVNNQTVKDFDLLLVNDNYSDDELKEKGEKAFDDTTDLSIYLVNLNKGKLSIAGTRIEMLRRAKQMGYELVVIGDADDTFSTDRVEQVKKEAELDKDSAFFYNELVKDNGEAVFSVIPDRVDDASTIAQENFLGMSTTAIRVDKLSDEFLDSLIEGDSPVFDWYLFTRILKDVGTGSFVDGCSTIYRLYDGNEVGTSRDLEKEKAVKLTHYANLAKRYDGFKKLHDDLQKIDTKNLKLSQSHQGYWWSDIKLEDSYEI